MSRNISAVRVTCQPNMFWWIARRYYANPLMVDTEALGDYIRDVREARKMKQADLGKRVGISRPTVSALERGHLIHPKLWVLEKVAEVLEIPASELLARAGVSPQEADDQTLLWLGEHLDDRRRRILISIGHELLKDQQSPPQTAPRSGGRRAPQRP